jgi:hypothetical protein
MLGKKELVVILVVLICVAVYLCIEYILTQRNINIEGFQMSMSNDKKINEMKQVNIDIFSFYRTFLENERLYYKNDIDIVNYLIVKKFNLKHFLSKPKIVDGNRTYVTNTKLVKLIDERRQYLHNIVNNLDFSIAEIQRLKDNHMVDNNPVDNTFYNLYTDILQDIRFIYHDKRSYLIEGNSNYFDIDAIMEVYDMVSSSDRPTLQASNIVDTLNGYINSSKANFRKSAENIEKKINELFNFIDFTNNIDTSVRDNIVSLLKTRMTVMSKIVVRDLSVEIMDNILHLAISGELTTNIKSEKTDAAKKSNKIVLEILDLLNTEIDASNEVTKFFNTSDIGRIILSDNEFKYFNTVDTNTNMLQKFCKKIKKMDRPKNSNLLFKRLAKEYVVKKNNQINKLNNNINQMMGEMTLKEAYDTNLYNLRTSEDAQKQINAIKEARTNIDSIGKFNINLK